MDKDTVVGIVGAVILIAAMVGVFYYEGTNEAVTGTGGSGWTVTWPTATTGGPSANGQTNEGQTSSQKVMIDASNLTKVEFTLTWTDDVGSADEFILKVTPPGGGAAKEASGSASPLTVTIDGCNGVPSEDDVGGSDEADAQSRLARTHTTSGCSGEYAVDITLTTAGDARDPTGTIVITNDGGNAWTLGTRLTSYSSEVARSS